MPRTLEIFDDLGVVSAVLAAGGAFPPFRGYTGGAVAWDRSIYEMAGFPRLTPSPELPYDDFWMLPQWRTCEILRLRLRELGVEVELGVALKHFVQDDRGVTAALDHGDRVEQVRAAYLVGADGGGSFVRKTLGVRFLGETDEADRSIIADVRAEGPDREHWHMWTHRDAPARRISLCPLPHTDIFQFVAPVAAGVTPALDLASLQSLFNERSGRTDVRLFDLSWATLYRVNIRLAERFRERRVFLAGDAAHVHFPGGGQGLNTGIQDAYNLGWKLALAVREGCDHLLDSYNAERLPVAADVLGFTSQLRERGFQVQPAPAEERQHDVFQLKLNYRNGLLSRDEREPSRRIRAGDRAPDGPGYDATGAVRRLFDIFRGPHFTLLVFSANGAALVETVNRKYALWVSAYRVIDPGQSADATCLIDRDGHIRRCYDAQADSGVLVRPDGYIGLMTNDLTERRVDDYLARGFRGWGRGA